MKITQLVSKPQIVKLTIDDAEVVEKYGEPVDFWTFDRQPMDVFMKLASASQTTTSEIIGTVKDLILDESGKPILTGDNMLPTDLLMRVIAKITEMLGK